jgi:putative sporulation protein YtaF
MFAACFAYGTADIHIPPLSEFIINLVSCLILGIALLAGMLLRPLLPSGLTNIICFVILLMMGLLKLCDGAVKALIRHRKAAGREITFSVSLFSLRFILHIYADPEEADRDRSRSLSAAESLPLAVALSLDALGAGFGAAISAIHIPLTLLITFICTAAAIRVGGALGRKLARRLPFDLSVPCGVLLMVLAIRNLL